MPSLIYQLPKVTKYKCQSAKHRTDAIARRLRKHAHDILQRGLLKENEKAQIVAVQQAHMRRNGRIDRDARFARHKQECAEIVIRRGRAEPRGCLRIREERDCEFCNSRRVRLQKHSALPKTAIKRLSKSRLHRRHKPLSNKRASVSKMPLIHKPIPMKQHETVQEHLHAMLFDE